MDEMRQSYGYLLKKVPLQFVQTLKITSEERLEFSTAQNMELNLPRLQTNLFATILIKISSVVEYINRWVI